MRKFFGALAVTTIVAGIVPVDGSSPAPVASKLRGGLSWMLEAGMQPDQRLDYLVPGFKSGEFVVYAVLDGPADRLTKAAAATGARVRWALRSIDAISAVASRDEVLELASKPWVRALYPVLSGTVDDTEAPISGTISPGEAPKVHDIAVGADSHSITVDLMVAPPSQPHTDANAYDFLEARLLAPNGRAVMVRPSFLHQISFKYGEPDALQTGTWKLQMWHRSANNPLAPVTFSYEGRAVVGGAAVTRDDPGIIEAGCATTRSESAWRKHENLKKRGVTDLGAPALWDGGLRGRGVRVAVLDTGTDASHVDLDDQDWERWGADGCAPKVIANALFTGGQKLPGQGIYDTGGHGTHVAGEIAGTAEGSTDEQRGKFPGVAPEASLIAGRIAIDVTALSDDMLAAAEWAVIDQKADVVNLSFGIDVRYGVLTDQNDPQSAGFEALATNPAWGHPSIQVSAGNSGDFFFTIAAPSVAPHVNTIAASVKDWDVRLLEGETRESGSATEAGKKDRLGKYHSSIAAFSSRGPTQDLFFSPDLAAPGVAIMAPRSNQVPRNPPMNGYVSFSGTSMAAPHASGCASLLIEGYRKAFGTSGAFGNRPPFWKVAAAMGNTAGSPAPRPGFAGGSLKKLSYAPGPDGVLAMLGDSGSRESSGDAAIPVGPLVEGAGRINLPGALAALTQGVLIYTDGDPASPAPHELQASVGFGTVKPTETIARTLRLDPATSHRYTVSFRAASGPPSLIGSVIPPTWWTLPAPATVSGGPVTAGVALTVPAGTKAGEYTGYLLADVLDATNGKRFSVRMPAMVVVEIVDLDASEGDDHSTKIDGYSAAGDPSTFLTLVVTGAVNSDWPMYAIDVPAGLERLDIDVTGTQAGEEWDLFLYDRYGVAVANTFRAVPTSSGSLSVSGLAPGEYRIAVSRSVPSPFATDDPVRGSQYFLSMDLVGASSKLPATVKGVKSPRRSAPRAKPAGGPLPATGLATTGLYVLGILGLGAAGALAFGLGRRPR